MLLSASNEHGVANVRHVSSPVHHAAYDVCTQNDRVVVHAYAETETGKIAAAVHEFARAAA